MTETIQPKATDIKPSVSCSRCGTKTAVQQTVRTDHERQEIVWRRRCCPACGKVAFTAEIPLDLANREIFETNFPNHPKNR